MKYAFMSFSTPSLTLAETLAVAAKYGYAGIEPRLDADHAHGIEVHASPAQRRAIVEQAGQAGIELACLATSLAYADPDKTVDMVTQSHERIDLAADLGVPVLRVFGGKMGEGLDREQAIELVARSLAEVADHAAERGVILCMETHDDWCNPEHVAAVMARTDHPCVAVNWDIMHPVRTAEATVDQAYQVLQPWIRHVHIHDGGGENLTFAAIGEGPIDHLRTLELLAHAEYDGYLSGEWIGWEAYDIHLPRELATMQGYERRLSWDPERSDG
jgi:sugar phosphate isomerase/epimerase